MVCNQLRASAHANMFHYAWKKPGYAIHKTCVICKHDCSITQLWIVKHVLLMGVPLLLLSDALLVLAFVLCILFPIPICTLMLSVKMKCNKKSFSCATMICGIYTPLSVNISDSINYFNLSEVNVSLHLILCPLGSL